jgi:hypothetical protein
VPVIELAHLSEAEGRQPADLTLERIIRKPVPLDWDAQARLYGFDHSVRGEGLLVGPALRHLPLCRAMLPEHATGEPGAGHQPQTVAEWNKRATVEEITTGPTEPRSTALCEA